MGKKSKNTSEKMNFIVSNETFEGLISKLEDLTKISDTLKFKMNKEEILIYSLVGDSAILAFKSYTLNTGDYITTDSEFDCDIDFIVPNAKRFVKQLKFFDHSEDVKLKLALSLRDSTENDSKMVRSFRLSDGRLKVNQIGGEPYKIRDISKTQLSTLLNPDNCKWSFGVSNKDLRDIKKLSTISADDRIIDISVNGGKISFSEGVKWKLDIGSTDEVENADITFAKKYLTSINTDNEDITFSVFDTFVLFNDKSSDLMVSFEQHFDED